MSEVSNVETTIRMECICGNTLAFLMESKDKEASAQCCECSRQIIVEKNINITIKKIKWKAERDAYDAGLQVEFKAENSSVWEIIKVPNWLAGYEYRILVFRPGLYRSRAGALMYFQTVTSGVLLVDSLVLPRSNVVSCLVTDEWARIKC